jgi:hypothetical protein
MSNVSLAKSIRTCKVYTGAAEQSQSDRFLNSANMVCIPWGNTNSKGQSVCADSFMTKTPGCNSAEDRVSVENDQRPQYSSYVTLNMPGVRGNIYANQNALQKSIDHGNDMRDNDQRTGNYGLQWSANTKYNGCSIDAYERNMAQKSKSDRERQNVDRGDEGYKHAQRSGF